MRFPKRIVCALAIVLMTMAACPVGGAAILTVPNTPAGKQLTAWLAAFNTGKRSTLRQYLDRQLERPTAEKQIVDDTADQQIALYKETGGLRIRKVTASNSAAITAIAQGRSTGYWVSLQVYIVAKPPAFVEAQSPYRVAGFGVHFMPAPPEFMSSERLTDRQIRRNVDALITKLASADQFSGTILVARNGRPIYGRACGLANRTWSAPNRLDTKFNLASICKMFTAVAVAQLVKHGRLSYHDLVGKILPDYPNRDVARQVTVEQLLTHTSGVSDVGGPPRTLTSYRQGYRTLKPYLAIMARDPLAFEPGAQFAYSNAGYILLGAIIEKASGESYYDYVRQHIFKPARMSNTDFYDLDTDPPNLASGYMDSPGGQRRDNIFYLPVRGLPNGCGYSTAADLVKFADALRSHKLLSGRATAALWSGRIWDAGHECEYGYGCEVSRYNGSRIIWHGGGWKGVTNQLDIYPDRGYTVAILSNIDSDPASISNKLREWLTSGSARTERPARRPKFVSSVVVSPSSPARGAGTVTIRATVKDNGGTVHGALIDLEIKDASGKKVEQRVRMNQVFDDDSAKTYRYAWTPSVPGAYTVDVGVFADGWQTQYAYATGVARITVK